MKIKVIFINILLLIHNFLAMIEVMYNIVE